ncbi:MAG: dipeptide epimerase [bacterium]
MRLDVSTYTLDLTIPFAIARGTTSRHEICIVEIEFDGITGYGEASPSSYYNDDIEKARRFILNSSAKLGDDPFAIEKISRALLSVENYSPSGKAAIEIALFDLVGKILGKPLFKILGLSQLEPPLTSFTVGVEDLESARRRLEFLKTFPILKVKLGFGDEVGLLQFLKSETDAILRADVNEGWDTGEAIEKINMFREEFDIEFFEQPLRKEDFKGYSEIRKETDAMIIVDESVKSAADVLKWAEVVDGINIKLMKSGGILEALRMITVARSLGLKVMLGCMVESSIGISAAASLSPLVDFCDLDGNLLINNDPFDGVKAFGGKIVLTDAPGLGLKRV